LALLAAIKLLWIDLRTSGRDEMNRNEQRAHARAMNGQRQGRK